MMKTWWMAASLGLLMACASGEPGPVPVEKQSAMSSRTEWVRARDPGSSPVLEAPARTLVSPSAAAAVSMPFPGRVNRIYVSPGSRISKNAPVVDVVMPELLEAAGQASASQYLISVYEKRRTQLGELEKEGLARLEDTVEVESRLIEARASLERARATLRAAGLSLEEGRKLLDGTGALTLRAPIEGVVVELNALSGEMRGPESGALARVSGAGEVRVEARFASAPPDAAVFAFLSSDARELPLVLESLSPLAETGDGARLGWFSFAPGVEPPLARSVGRVVAKLGKSEGVVSLMSGAVALKDGVPVVIEKHGESWRMRRVAVVASAGHSVLVRALEGEALRPETLFASDPSLMVSEAP